jgi:hypothetical protein
MATKSPDPVFEVVFQGIYPERIPLGTLSRILSAIQRLASGADTDEDDDQPGELPASGNQIQLLGVKRGSAVYRFAGDAASHVMQRLRLVGDVLADPGEIGENDYLLSPLERISTSAKTLGCQVVVRKPGKDGSVLAEIGPKSFDEIAKSIFVSGETSITGNVQRVGGATDMRCALRVPFQQRLLFCKVKTQTTARTLGDCLYKDVQATGQARWIKSTWHVNAFTVTGVAELKNGSILNAFEAMRDAGGSGWDKFDDPQRVLEGVTGK